MDFFLDSTFISVWSSFQKKNAKMILPEYFKYNRGETRCIKMGFLKYVDCFSFYKWSKWLNFGLHFKQYTIITPSWIHNKQWRTFVFKFEILLFHFRYDCSPVRRKNRLFVKKNGREFTVRLVNKKQI